jgi:hypothetical protein
MADDDNQGQVRFRVVVESRIIADEDTINGGATEGLGEEVDSSCSTGMREN